MAKKSKILPPVGSVIAYQLPNGLYTTFRVLRAKSMDGPKYVLVACSQYISKELPSVVTDEMRIILKTTYPGRMGKRPSIYWISSPVDGKSKVVGKMPPSKEEKLFEKYSTGHWLNLQQDALKQWYWEHDRVKLQALDAEEANETLARRKRADALQSAHDTEMKSMTLEKLARYRFFPHWDDYPPAKVIMASRQIMNEHVVQFITLGKTGTKSQKTSIVKSCVEAFNDLNVKHGDFVDTDIREDIAEEVSRLSRACGLGDMAKEIDNWRDW